MRKIDLVAEKRIRNEEYALRFRRTKSAEEKVSRWLNWCRVKGHPSSCSVKDCPSK